MCKIFGRWCSQRIAQENDTGCATAFVGCELAAELLSEDRYEIGAGDVRDQVGDTYASVHEDVHDVIDDDHFGERVGAGKEVVLECISKVAEDTLEQIVCPYERRDIVARGKRDGDIAYILGALYGIVEVGAGSVNIGMENLYGGNGDEFEPVTSIPPLRFHFYDLHFAVCIEDFVVETCVEP